MHISVTCSACGQAFRVDAKFAGRRGKCPNPECGQTYTVPLSEEGSRQTSREKSEARSPKSLSWGNKSSRQEEPVDVDSDRDLSHNSARRRKKPSGYRIQFDKTSFAAGAGVALIIALLAFCFLPTGTGRNQSSSIANENAKTGFSADVVPLVKKYCSQCHDGDMPEAGIAFSKYADEHSMLKDRKTWERSFEMISQGVMPPADSPQPTDAEKARLIEYLEKALFRIDCTQVTDPGRVTIRRLNRNEYNNTIRDLLGVSVRPADDFPSDDVGYGFDNIGDVLSLPPLLMEKYLDAAEKIAAEAISVIDSRSPPVREFTRNEIIRSPVVHPQGEDAMIIVSTGELSVEMDFPRTGKYVFKSNASETPAGNEHARMEIRLDGKKIQSYEITSAEPQPQKCDHTFSVNKGKHRVSIAFLNDFYDEKAKDKKKRDRNLVVRDVKIVGPVELDPQETPESHKRLLAISPGGDKSAGAAARENLTPFLRRAFRRPVTEEEIKRFVGLVERAVSNGESFAFGIRLAVTATLVSPHFLFRIETDTNPNDPNDKHALNDFQLASRLSYFLWSSMPDDELLSLAEKNELHTDAALDQQVKRMLKDPRSSALVDNFAEQWLQLRILNEITPDPKRFPEFNADLREDMKRETRRFFEHVMREDRSILEFLDGPYTFLNERLAKHYGIEGVKGPEFQQVSLQGKSRAGLLTHASILTLTSNPDRTSPVKRGKWVMEVILDKPPPPPPPNVPELEETAKAKPGTTLRQQLELHRENASCASCHRMMDQLGFGMENFDAIGRWRDTDAGQPLDTTGELPGGSNFKGPIELAGVLRRRQCEFGECLAEKMLTYALGRGLEFYDRCATDKITAVLKENDFRFSVLVSSIAKSDPFRMRRGEETRQ